MKNFLFTLLIPVLFLLFSGCRQSATKETASGSPAYWYLLAGSYTGTGFTLDGADSGIYVLRMNVSTGELSCVQFSPHTENPSWLVYDSLRRQVFSVNENEAGGISSFIFDPATMSLRFVNRVSSEGKYPCYLSVDPSGKYLLAANYGSGNVAVFPVGPDGKISKAVSVHQHAGKGPDPDRQEGPHAHMILPSPDGQFFYGTDLGTDEIYVYNLNPENGSLVPVGFTVKTSPGTGPRHIAFHHSKPWVYVIGELNGTIEAFLYEKTTGNLNRFQIVATRKEGDERFAGCADIHIHPSGKFLYATNRGDINEIVLFEIDQNTGKLTRRESYPSGGKTPRNFTISPDGRFLLCANQKTNNIGIFRIDAETGKLTPTENTLAVPAPVCLQFIP